MVKASNIIIFLSVLSSVLILLYITQPDKNSNSLETELKKFDTNSSSNIIEISNPVFKSKGLNSNSYEIRAKNGIQEGENIKLYDIRAEFEGKNNKFFYVSADKGWYTQQNGMIELLENVVIVDELKNKTSTRKAKIDTNIRKIILTEKVISITGTGNSVINSDKSIVDDKNETITYLVNVKVTIRNE